MRVFYLKNFHAFMFFEVTYIPITDILYSLGTKWAYQTGKEF